MTDIHSLYGSIANPRRTTLVSLSAAEAAAPHREEPALQMLGDDATASADGNRALPD